MKTYILPVMALLLVGCNMEKEKTPHNSNDKYRITQCFEKRMDLVWTTPHKPVADKYGFIFLLADGSEVRISGDIIIQELK